MQVDGEHRPCDKRPGLLRVPAPVSAPGLVSPSCAREYAEGKQWEAEEDEPVGRIVKALELLFRQAVQVRALSERQPAYLNRGAYDKDRVREKGENDMRFKPPALQRRGEGLCG